MVARPTHSLAGETVTQADLPYIVTMRTGTESVFALGSREPLGGSKTAS